jgi:hypothetical protein
VRNSVRDTRPPMRYPIGVSFEQALDNGDLDRASAILDELVPLPDTGGLWLPECYADLAQALTGGRRRRRRRAATSPPERGFPPIGETGFEPATARPPAGIG